MKMVTDDENRFREFAVYTIQWLDRTGRSNSFMREVTDLVLNYGYTVEDAKARVKEINNVHLPTHIRINKGD